MTGARVRISERARGHLRALAEQEGRSMQAVLDVAIESYRRQRMLESVNDAYAALRSDSEAWAEVGEQGRLWDATLEDGLGDQERWDTETRCPNPSPHRGSSGPGTSS